MALRHYGHEAGETIPQMPVPPVRGMSAVAVATAAPMAAVTESITMMDDDRQSAMVADLRVYLSNHPDSNFIGVAQWAVGWADAHPLAVAPEAPVATAFQPVDLDSVRSLWVEQTGADAAPLSSTEAKTIVAALDYFIQQVYTSGVEMPSELCNADEARTLLAALQGKGK